MAGKVPHRQAKSPIHQLERYSQTIFKCRSDDEFLGSKFLPDFCWLKGYVWFMHVHFIAIIILGTRVGPWLSLQVGPVSECGIHPRSQYLLALVSINSFWS